MSDFMMGLLVGIAGTVGAGLLQLACFAWLAPVEVGRDIEDRDAGEDGEGTAAPLPPLPPHGPMSADAVGASRRRPGAIPPGAERLVARSGCGRPRAAAGQKTGCAA